ncbi:MAG: cupin domain-containing protein [Melioribacteraceae bacterium]|nr:cupin domain-containing protein [Melioribacteraceae bacterium]
MISEIIIKNIFCDIPEKPDNELIEVLLNNPAFKMERIISQGHASPDNFWYDQDKNEFVLLISGSAKISFEKEDIVEIRPGDYFIIPAHKKHRVEFTKPGEKTIWLTLHF